MREDLRYPGGGPHFGGGPIFGGGRGRRRRGDVRLALLLLLAETPRNGYQLMQAIEERSGGRWRPSPGSVYPTLAQLEDEGLIRATADSEDKKRFELTDDGRAHLEERPDHAPPWATEDDPAGEAIHELKVLVKGVAEASRQVAHVGDERQIRQARDTLAETRKSLYRILAEDDE